MDHGARKPTGLTGPVRVTPEKAEFQQVVFPSAKAEIEEFVVRAFAAQAQPDGLRVNQFTRNRESDLDFGIVTNIGPRQLELMEVAPLEHLGGSYTTAPSNYKPYELAEFVYGKLMHKSSRYAGIKDGIFLLVYTTHWAFSLSETVVALLQYWLATKPHSFERAYAFHPTGASLGICHLLSPTPLEFWKSFDPELCRDNVVHNFSPLGWQHVRSSG